MRRQPRKRQSKVRITHPMRMILSAAKKQREAYHHPKLGLSHWVTALRELFPVLPGKAAWDDIKVMDLRSKLKEGDFGPVFTPEIALTAAARLAKAEGLSQPTAYELVRVVLRKAKPLASKSAATPEDSADLNRAAESASAEAAQPEPEKTPRDRPTPILDLYGRDLTAEADEGLLCRIVARDDQVALMIESLCRTSKRNIALIGPPGVGKRGLVECLASRVRSGHVPEILLGTRVVEVQFIAIVAGATSFDELRARVGQIVKEASDPKTVLFFDDLRAVMAAGSEGPGAAIAGQLKPDIVHGTLTCIVSGSEEDYRRITDVDPTWQNWFQPIRVDELTPAKTLDALEAISDHAATMTGVQVPRAVQKWIVEFATEFMKSQRFPGKAADLLEQTVAHAVRLGAKKVSLRHAHAVAGRAMGLPTEIPLRLGRVSEALAESGILTEDDRRLIEERLSVTLRSLDLRPDRPNAIVLLAGESASWGHALAGTLAKGIAGSPDRVIAIDLSRFDEPWDLRQLVGPADGKPASREAHALFRLVDAPWSVVLLENVDACHSHVRATITRALEAGYFTDVTGRKIHLSDAIVVFTAPTIEVGGRHTVGFVESDPVHGGKNSAFGEVLSREMAALLDVVITHVATPVPPAIAARKKLFQDLARRYRSRGLHIIWDPSILEWFADKAQDEMSQENWDDWADQTLAAALIPHLPAKMPATLKHVTVGRSDGALVVSQTTASPERGGAGMKRRPLA